MKEAEDYMSDDFIYMKSLEEANELRQKMFAWDWGLGARNDCKGDRETSQGWNVLKLDCSYDGTALYIY